MYICNQIQKAKTASKFCHWCLNAEILDYIYICVVLLQASGILFILAVFLYIFRHPGFMDGWADVLTTMWVYSLRIFLLNTQFEMAFWYPPQMLYDRQKTGSKYTCKICTYFLKKVYNYYIYIALLILRVDNIVCWSPNIFIVHSFFPVNAKTKHGIFYNQ